MGLDRNAVRFLMNAKEKGVKFDSALTLGRQWLILTDAEVDELLPRLTPDYKSLKTADGFADAFLKALGVKDLKVMDVSDYEKADVLHDMNNAIPDNLRLQFDVVIDGGTTEHV